MAFRMAETTRPQLYRIVYIDKTIKAMRYPNARSLAEELEVHQRTILRDVGFMKDMLSAPLEYDPKKRGFFYNQADYTLGLLKITEGELLALCLGHNLLVKCKGTPYTQAIISAFNKICGYAQDTVEIDFGQLTEAISFDLEPLRGDEKRVAAHFAAIGAAIKERKTVNLLHYAIARDSCRERLVDPYQLRYYQGAWYMIGFCHFRRAVRIFARDRIREIKHTFTPADRFFNVAAAVEKTINLSAEDGLNFYLTGKIEGQPVRAVKDKKGQGYRLLGRPPGEGA